MTANQFYVPRLDPRGVRLTIQGGEHRHLAKAARVLAGESVWLFDAVGRRCLARVETVGKDRTELAVLIMEEPAAPRLRLVLAVGLLEAKTMDLVVEKAAELGCSAVVPVTSVRSLRMPEERAAKRVERWARVAREAVKQCKGRQTPAVEPPRALADFVSTPPAGVRYFLSERGGRPLREIVAGGAEAERANPPASAVLLVGPKGGWTVGEETDLRRAGFEALSLGQRILRAETAALAGAAMLLHFWNG